MQAAGKAIIVAGILAVIIGFIMYKGWGSLVFGWIGHLPGDIRVDNGNVRIYFPIMTCVVISIIATIVIRLYVYLAR